jgi:hypothetical protein
MRSTRGIDSSSDLRETKAKQTWPSSSTRRVRKWQRVCTQYPIAFILILVSWVTQREQSTVLFAVRERVGLDCDCSKNRDVGTVLDSLALVLSMFCKIAFLNVIILK